MLNQFVLRNYRLFKNETLLDFFPAPINDNKASLLTAAGRRRIFLPVTPFTVQTAAENLLY